MKNRWMIITMAALLFSAIGCKGGWTAAERDLTEIQPSVMRVLTVEDEADLIVLRTPFCAGPSRGGAALARLCKYALTVQ